MPARDGAIVLLVMRRILELVGLGRSPDAKDPDIAVLRRQLSALRRQTVRPRCRPSHGLVLAMLAQLLPWERWAVFRGYPATLINAVADDGNPPLQATGGRGPPRQR